MDVFLKKKFFSVAPQNNTYNNLGQDCAGAGCTVDLFLFNNAYIDLATIGQVSRLTGGEVFKYTYFQSDIDGERLIVDISKNISRPVAFDSVMRVRTSTGTRPTDFYGHFFMSNTTDMEIAGIGKKFNLNSLNFLTSLLFFFKIVINQLQLKLSMMINYHLKKMFMCK